MENRLTGILRTRLLNLTMTQAVAVKELAILFGE